MSIRVPLSVGVQRIVRLLRGAMQRTFFTLKGISKEMCEVDWSIKQIA